MKKRLSAFHERRNCDTKERTCQFSMKRSEKRPLKRFMIVALLLLAGAGATFAVARQLPFSVGVSSAAGWTKLDQFAEAAKKIVSSSQPPSSSCASAQSRAEEKTVSSEPEVRTITLEKAVKPLKIEVSLKDQKVSVLDAKDCPVREFICSSGENGSETPTGTFTVEDRGTSFYNPKVQEGAYYWTRFYKSYLFHSVPFDKNREMEPQEAAKLGTPASHGCIRLETEDAKWIYDHIPKGTEVVVH